MKLENFKKIIFMLIFSMFFLNFVFAVNDDFQVGEISIKTPADYQDGAAIMKVRITSLNDVCSQSCEWYTSDESKQTFEIAAGKTFDLEFNSDAIVGQGRVADIFYITCDDGWCGNPDSESISFIHTYDYEGDEKCKILNNHEDCTNAKTDCVCSSGKSCIDEDGDSSRDVDEMKCATYCSNGVKESSYETCSNCPMDVGKCNGLDCLSGSECEGSYCVHELCWNKPYKENDGFCDFNRGENCKNSVDDCSCGSNERCGSLGICEIYCGNNVCEESEKGICKEDCDWCGDGECNNKESCGSCLEDCGECENEKSNKEVIENAKEAVDEKISEVQTNQKNVILGGVILIVLVVIGYIVFKFGINNQPKKKNGKKTTKKKTKK